MRYIAASMILFFAFSCAPHPEEEAARAVVRAYNKALVQAYGDTNLNYMKPLITEKELNRLFPSFQFFLLSNLRMVTVQKEFKEKDIKIREKKAVVETVEKWEYWWENRLAGEIARPKEEITYHLRYHLKKTPERWVVDFIEQVE